MGKVLITLVNMINSPLVSIIMPVYNGSFYLKEAILSILNQTYKNFEFIIIDDGSTDNSLEIIQEFNDKDNRIQYISRENRGLVFSLNQALGISSGKYIARMDADDISLPNRLLKQVELMEHEFLDICGCHYHIIGENNKFLDSILVPLDHQSLLLYLYHGVPFAHGSVMFRHKFLIKNNIKYGENFTFAEDKALWMKMYDLGAKFGNLNEFLFLYREYNKSLSKQRKSLILKDINTIRKNIIANHLSKIYCLIKESASNIKFLSQREVEYLSDLILLFIFSKRFKFFLLPIFYRIPIRYKIISFFKLVRSLK